jgi:predicted nucleotidyltransferase component of viral defense system
MALLPPKSVLRAGLISKFLHDLPDFKQLIAAVSDKKGIAPTLVEKDYWIMHCLWGLQAQGYRFELKGGTSLSKGYGVIHRFSEDIDIRIEPPKGSKVKFGRNHDKPAHVESRRAYYAQLAAEINIPGIVSVKRETAFDDEKQLRSAGIRLQYQSIQPVLEGVKDGVLLELGFDDTTPNVPLTISSWAWGTANDSDIKIIDNRAKEVRCYAATHTFVEKLQTISTKYRRLGESEIFPTNFLRHYYDVYCLLSMEEVQDFIRNPAYQERKIQRFRSDDEIVIAQNPAFVLERENERQLFEKEFRKTKALYYQGQPDFQDILEKIHDSIELM